MQLDLGLSQAKNFWRMPGPRGRARPSAVREDGCARVVAELYDLGRVNEGLRR